MVARRLKETTPEPVIRHLGLRVAELAMIVAELCADAMTAGESLDDPRIVIAVFNYEAALDRYRKALKP